MNVDELIGPIVARYEVPGIEEHMRRLVHVARADALAHAAALVKGSGDETPFLAGELDVAWHAELESAAR